MVVGGGSAGCTLAGRLAAAGRCRVLVLEAGRSAGCRRSSTSPPSPPPRRATRPTGRTRSSCAPAAPRTIPRGRVLGGSGAVNGAVWMRATPADGWGLPGWTWADMLARYVRSEADADLGDRPGHGADGPVPVARPAGALLHPAAERFLAAAAACGFPG